MRPIDWTDMKAASDSIAQTLDVEQVGEWAFDRGFRVDQLARPTLMVRKALDAHNQ